MDNQQQGAELNQLSRILFDKAGWLWQISIVAELTAGVISVVISLLQPALETSTAWAIVVVGILVVAFYSRCRFGAIYDIAETMRRQSVLSEGIGLD